jgi:predicted metal-binding protein
MVDNADAVESIAKAFYSAQEGARGWEREPETLKERFRTHARAAITLLDEAAESRRLSNL